MTKTVWNSEYFCGNKISDYGLENGYVDYRALAESFDAVLSNDIMSATAEIGYWEQENGYIDYTEEIEELREKIEELTDAITDDSTKEEDEKTTKKIEKLEEEIEELQNAMDYPPEVFQWYIIDDGGAQILKDYTDEIVYYNETLDMYLWGVTHWGTSWDYVLTNIKIERKEA